MADIMNVIDAKVDINSEMEKQFQKWLEKTKQVIKDFSPTKLEMSIHRNCFYEAYLQSVNEITKKIIKIRNSR